MAVIDSGEKANEIAPLNKVAFRWTYIVLPAALLIISLILTAIFYRLLPEEVAYHFQNSTPDKWLNRQAITAWLVIPHIFCVAVAFIIVRTAMFSTRYYPLEDTPITIMIPVMGNMIALIQIILVFATLDIFLYNVYEIKLMPLWIFALIVMALGAVALGIFFIRTIRQYRRLRGKNLQE